MQIKEAQFPLWTASYKWLSNVLQSFSDGRIRLSTLSKVLFEVLAVNHSSRSRKYFLLPRLGGQATWRKSETEHEGDGLNAASNSKRGQKFSRIVSRSESLSS
jgi:hypothetical protein